MGNRDVNLIQENLDITEDAEGWLLSQFRESPNILKLLRVFTTELQEIESSATIPLLYSRTVEEAQGQQLDNLGVLLKVQRNGLTDDQYRVLLKLVGLKKTNRGTIDDILNIIRFVTGDESATLSRGFNYDVNLAFAFCVDEGTFLTVGDPPFGFLNNPTARGWSSPTDTSGGIISYLLRDQGVSRDLIIQQILEILPVVTSVKIIDKPSQFFGFEGNSGATGFAASSTDTTGGALSSQLYTNRS